MSQESRRGSIVHVTADSSTSLQYRLRNETAFEVRTTAPTNLEEALDPGPPVESAVSSDTGQTTGTESNAGPDTTVTESNDADDVGRPVAVVFELECPERTKATIERFRADRPSVPAVVVPPSGSEDLATAALRADADEYVPLDAEEDPVERIVETARSDHDRESNTAGGSRRENDRFRTPAGTSSATNGGTDGEYHRILANELPDEAFVISADGTYLEAKVHPGAPNLDTVPADGLVGSRLEDAFSDDVATTLQRCIDRTLRTGDVQSIEYGAETTDGDRRWEARVVPIDERIDGERAVVWLARDITERARRERELRSRQDQLETLNRINAVVTQVIETLIEAPSRDAIERKVCEQLVDSELYCGSWIGERVGEGTLSYRTGAGSAEAYLEHVSERDVDEGMASRAVRTGAIQTETSVAESDGVPEPLRTAARADDVTAAIAVPVSHNDSIYGVLNVLARRDEAFTEDEQAGFRLLGETIGFTIMAVKNRQLLFADTVVELEFRIDGGETFSFDLSETYDCTCSLEWAGTTSSGRAVQYVTIDDLDGATVLEEADAHHSIEECRLIHDGQGSCTAEIRFSESGVRTLANHGATIRDVTVEDGVGTCLVEVSQDADVREIADALAVVYENTELVARREVDRTVRTAAERRNRILDRLTDRQLTTLRLGYYGGFFEWPRDSTGEEIAEAMGVSPPTMHQHLRKGLETVLGEFFEPRDETA